MTTLQEYDSRFQTHVVSDDDQWRVHQRQTAFAALSSRGLPTTKHERFRKAALSRFLSPSFAPASLAAVAQVTTTPTKLNVPTHAFEQRENGRVVERTGDLAVFASAAASNEAFLTPLFARTGSNDASPFANLNVAFCAAENTVEIPANTTVDAPIVVDNHYAGDNVEFHPRALVVVRRGASATLIEFVDARGLTLVNRHTDVVVEDGASLVHILVYRGDEHSRVLAGHYVSVGRDASVHTLFTSLTDGALRTDIDVELQATGATATLNGLTLGDGAAHVDHQTRIVHHAGHATSRQTFKGVFGGKSNGVFTGAVVFQPGAEKSDTAQKSQSILLSDTASAHQKPELQIFADDVKASHGSTVGQLDDASLFYLQSRGIPRFDAIAMLVRAFAADVVEALPENAQAILTPFVEARTDVLLGGAS